MKLTPLFAAAASLASAIVSASADPKADLVAAIQKLGEQPNYSWTSTPRTEGSESARRAGPVDGRTEKTGFTRIKGSMGDTAYEVGFKGDKMVVNYNGDWLSAAEIGENNNAIRRLRAFKRPVEEADDLLKRAKEIKREGDSNLVSEMTAEAAREIFGQLGRRAAEAAAAQGSMKFRVADGRLAGYEFTVSGTITVGEDKREVKVSRTTTVEIKDVGTTRISFPDDAKKKLAEP